MYLLIHCFSNERGESEIRRVSRYNSSEEVKDALKEAVEQFRDGLKEAYVLHDYGTEVFWHIDIRGGVNEFYSWDTVKV